MIDQCVREDHARRAAHLMIMVALALVFLVGLVRHVRAQEPITTGSIATSGGTVVIPVANVPAAAVQISGSTWSGFVVFDATADGGTTWWPIVVTSMSDGSPRAATSVNGLFTIQNAGYTQLRVRALTGNTGTITVTATRGFAAIVPMPIGSACNGLLRSAGKC